jgi:hypothetical protein
MQENEMQNLCTLAAEVYKLARSAFADKNIKPANRVDVSFFVSNRAHFLKAICFMICTSAIVNHDKPRQILAHLADYVSTLLADKAINVS